MKDLGEANFVLSIQILRDQNNKMIALSLASYIDKILEGYAMIDLKKGNQPSISRFHLSLEDYPKTTKERENMKKVPYASIVGSVMHTPKYLFCSGIGKLISGESGTKALGSS
ncbi:gag/pol protein [Gossypium australe]|uniref:Gag/pol protein n=1 Tax=Gossypium australe TaxID=47621 RepID=A0A5B6WSG4_9ROSI|nr:gag/pol protein [Gossypium australe]